MPDGMDLNSIRNGSLHFGIIHGSLDFNSILNGSLHLSGILNSSDFNGILKRTHHKSHFGGFNTDITHDRVLGISVNLSTLPNGCV